ncbi:MAG: DUF4038 domain-containing protein [Luteitalea sp.]|nr:DUF4038 domain-containing protein [Luteitalea sp.]
MQKAKSLPLVLVLACATATAGQSDPAHPPAGSEAQQTSQETLPPLKVHPDRRYLIRADGTPFLYLSDTAWELFHRPSREQVRAYLELRAQQRFTVIHAVALAELDGIHDPNVYGDLPLIDKDPARPAVTPGANPQNPQEYDYWDHVDYIVDEANRLGLYVAFLPTWGRWLGVNPQRDEKILTAQNAQAYGEFLGKRYGKKAIIWVLGGDRTAQGFEDVWRAMAKGIVIGIAGREDYDTALTPAVATPRPPGSIQTNGWTSTCSRQGDAPCPPFLRSSCVRCSPSVRTAAPRASLTWHSRASRVPPPNTRCSCSPNCTFDTRPRLSLRPAPD